MSRRQWLILYIYMQIRGSVIECLMFVGVEEGYMRLGFFFFGCSALFLAPHFHFHLRAMSEQPGCVSVAAQHRGSSAPSGRCSCIPLPPHFPMIWNPVLVLLVT